MKTGAQLLREREMTCWAVLNNKYLFTLGGDSSSRKTKEKKKKNQIMIVYSSVSFLEITFFFLN